MTMDEWITAFCREAGVQPPTAREVTELLNLAATAAHASERPAAPLTCWVASRSARPIDELLLAAKRLASD